MRKSKQKMFLKHLMHSQNNSFERNISVHFCWLGPVANISFGFIEKTNFVHLQSPRYLRILPPQDRSIPPAPGNPFSTVYLMKSWMNLLKRSSHGSWTVCYPGSANTPPWSRAAARNLPNGCENGDKLSDRFRSFVSQNSQIACSAKGRNICGMETQWDKSVEPATSENPTNPAKRRHFWSLDAVWQWQKEAEMSKKILALTGRRGICRFFGTYKSTSQRTPPPPPPCYKSQTCQSQPAELSIVLWAISWKPAGFLQI